MDGGIHSRCHSKCFRTIRVFARDRWGEVVHASSFSLSPSPWRTGQGLGQELMMEEAFTQGVTPNAVVRDDQGLRQGLMGVGSPRE